MLKRIIKIMMHVHTYLYLYTLSSSAATSAWSGLCALLVPLALTYLRTRKPSIEVWSVIYQINETEESFLESADRMVLRTDAGGEFSCFLSTTTFFRFPFTFGVRGIRDKTCTVSTTLLT